jgi:hypothetical protein
MKNLLNLATAKKTKLESMSTVKLAACQNGEMTVISENGKLIPANELQKFENGFAYVTGLFASEMVGVMSACRQNQITA